MTSVRAHVSQKLVTSKTRLLDQIKVNPHVKKRDAGSKPAYPPKGGKGGPRE